MNKTIGGKIKQARVEKGIGREDLAAMLKVTTGTIAHWENGTRTCKPAQLAQLAKVLNKSVGFFFGETPQEGNNLEQVKAEIIRTLKSGMEEIKKLLKQK